MNDEINRAAESLFGNPLRRTCNVKYYFRDETTASQLADYRNRASAQISSGISKEDTILDSALLD
jgi:hypothetical protein